MVSCRGAICADAAAAPFSKVRTKEHGKALGIIGRGFSFPCRPVPWLHESAASRVSWRSPTSCKSPALTVLFLCGVRRSDPMEKEERERGKWYERAGELAQMRAICQRVRRDGERGRKRCENGRGLTCERSALLGPPFYLAVFFAACMSARKG